MILIFGIPSEAPTRLAVEAAREEGIDHEVLSQRELHHSELQVEIRDGVATGFVLISGQRRNLTEYTGVYVRIMDVATLPDFRGGSGRGVTGSLARERAHANLAAFVDWLELAECRVASRPGAMTSNDSKPYQARLIERCGLRTPATLITNDPGAVRRFAERHPDVIYKSASGVRSIVQRLDARALRRLDRVRMLPTQFQAHVPGVDVRVHVAGDDVHATTVRSTATDYRYARLDGAGAALEPHDLPGEVLQRCRAVSQALDLPLCGLDLRRTPDGEYVCFEANPMPAFAYYQLETGQPIARSLVRWLAGGATEPSDGPSRRELVAAHGDGARGQARSGAP